MTSRSTVLLMLCVAASTVAHSQVPATESSARAVRFSKETSTLHCSKFCVVKVGPKDKVRFEAGQITSDRITGLVTLKGSVRVVFPDGELLAESATLTTDANGMQSIRSEDMRLVSPKFKTL